MGSRHFSCHRRSAAVFIGFRPDAAVVVVVVVAYFQHAAAYAADLPRRLKIDLMASSSPQFSACSVFRKLIPEARVVFDVTVVVNIWYLAAVRIVYRQIRYFLWNLWAQNI